MTDETLNNGAGEQSPCGPGQHRPIQTVKASEKPLPADEHAEDADQQQQADEGEVKRADDDTLAHGHVARSGQQRQRRPTTRQGQQRDGVDQQEQDGEAGHSKGARLDVADGQGAFWIRDALVAFSRDVGDEGVASPCNIRATSNSVHETDIRWPVPVDRNTWMAVSAR